MVNYGHHSDLTEELTGPLKTPKWKCNTRPKNIYLKFNVSRSDFLWRSKLNSEQEGVDTMRGINKILLENILPAHVAEHYLLRAQGVAGVLREANVRVFTRSLGLMASHQAGV